MRWLHTGARAVGGALFLALFGIFLLQIAARFLWARPLPWSDEAAVILYIWVILWAAALLVPPQQHVVFDLVWNHCGARARRLLVVAGNALVGRKKHRTFALNGRLDVVVDKVDRFKRIIDFRPA